MKSKFCKQIGITENQFNGDERIYHSLDLRSLTSIPEGFNPTVGGSLDLRSLTSIPEGFNPTVGGSLDLRSLTSIPEGFNPTVGGSLYLSSLTSIPEGFNPTVGGYLDLRSDLRSKITTNHIDHENMVFSWQNGKYIKSDNIFCEVIKRRRDVYLVKMINKPEESFLVTDGNGKWSHGDTLKSAKEDLLFKISDRNKDDYKALSCDSELTFEKAIECYRVITGACAFGTKDFVNNRLKNKNKKYSIRQIMELTKGEYGHNDFKKFFNK
jgi:hypothetical protein